MNVLLPLLILLGTGLLLVAGCTTPIVPTSETPPLTPPEVTLPPPTPSLIPMPTDRVPPSQQVAIQVTKNTVSIDPWVSVLFAGGAGQPYVAVMTATIIRSDGVTETTSAPYPGIGTNIMLSGTTRTDRVIVNVSYTDGHTYTVKDERVPFQSKYS